MKKSIICFGEVLWDLIPTGAVPGGAPMNVAIRAQSLGIDSKIISRIGNDKFGNDLLSYLIKKQVDTSLLQTDNNLPTGLVKVNLSKNGIATYDIKYPSAWDKIELTKTAIERVKCADAFIFGSLVCRDEVSANTLLNLLEYSKFRVFDVNLRPPFYDISVIEELIQKSDLVKLNIEELSILVKALGSKTNDIKENILFLHQKLKINSICVTRGGNGAILYIEETFYSTKGIKVNVVDTIGAGDSFLAALIYRYLNCYDYEETIKFSCVVGALVASKTGANPVINKKEIMELVKSI